MAEKIRYFVHSDKALEIRTAEMENKQETREVEEHLGTGGFTAESRLFKSFAIPENGELPASVDKETLFGFDTEEKKRIKRNSTSCCRYCNSSIKATTGCRKTCVPVLSFPLMCTLSLLT